MEVNPNFENTTSNQLKAELRKFGAKLSGRKSEFIDR